MLCSFFARLLLPCIPLSLPSTSTHALQTRRMSPKRVKFMSQICSVFFSFHRRRRRFSTCTLRLFPVLSTFSRCQPVNARRRWTESTSDKVNERWQSLKCWKTLINKKILCVMRGYCVRLAKANNDEFINVTSGAWRWRNERQPACRHACRSNNGDIFINIVHTQCFERHKKSQTTRLAREWRNLCKNNETILIYVDVVEQ